jgi:hypothetical protein
MNNRFFYIIQFLLVMIFQIMILNTVEVKSAVLIFGIPVFIPLIYPMLILLLPSNVNYFVMMLYALVIGFTLDYFSNTPGLHAASLVLLAYLRPRILMLFYQQDIKKIGSVKPTMYRLGFMSFLFYITCCILIHHLFFYTLQVWSFKNIPLVLFKTLLSGLITIIMIMIGQFIFYTNRNIKV